MAETVTKKRVRHEEEVVAPVSEISPTIVLGNVLRVLGKPRNLSQVSPSLTRATPVTKNSFRVNIFTVEDNGFFSANKLTHSFFVKVDDSGCILSSNPEIRKHYE